MGKLRVSVDLSEDRQWLDAFRRGETAALERVFRTYASLVFHLARGRRSGAGPAVFASDADLDDVVQDVFVRLFAPALRQRYDGIRPFAHLVAAVTRNTMVDHLRVRGRTEPLDDSHTGAPLELWSPGQPLPDETLLNQEEEKAAADLLAELSPEERGLAKARFEDGLSQRDAAESLGLTRQVLRTLEARLRAKMDAFARRRGF